MKIVCDKCDRDMRVKDIGVVTLDLAYDPPEAYTTCNTDRFVCPECGNSVLINPSSSSIRHVDAEKKRELSRLLEVGCEIVVVYETKHQKLNNKPVEIYLKE